MLSVDRFTSQLDDITSWLNETENILNDRISAADRDQMWKLLDIVKVHHFIQFFFKRRKSFGYVCRADIKSQTNSFSANARKLIKLRKSA